jgi:hypothetical protein
MCHLVGHAPRKPENNRAGDSGSMAELAEIAQPLFCNRTLRMRA